MTLNQIHQLNLSSLHRHTIGFEQLFSNLIDIHNRQDGNYPPHNLIKVDDTHFAIEVAVAGFSESEITVELKDNVLTVSGQHVKTEQEIEYIHKGISSRNFERIFTLAEHVEVRGATVKDGILVIGLEVVIPEDSKPKKIAITFQK